MSARAGSGSRGESGVGRGGEVVGLGEGWVGSGGEGGTEETDCCGGEKESVRRMKSERRKQRLTLVLGRSPESVNAHDASPVLGLIDNEVGSRDPLS